MQGGEQFGKELGCWRLLLAPAPLRLLGSAICLVVVQFQAHTLHDQTRKEVITHSSSIMRLKHA